MTVGGCSDDSFFVRSVCTKLKLLDLDLADDGALTLTANVLLTLLWTDPRLAYGEEKKNVGKGVHRIVLNPEHIWVPDLVFYNTE